MLTTADNPPDTLPEDDEVADFLLEFAIDTIVPMFTTDPDRQVVARRAVLRTLVCHRPTDEADLLLTTQMVGFGIAAARILPTAMSPGLPPPERKRILSCAAGLTRLEGRLRRLHLVRRRAVVAKAPAPASFQTPLPAPVRAKGQVAVQTKGQAPVQAKGQVAGQVAVQVKGQAPVQVAVQAPVRVPVAEAAREPNPTDAATCAPMHAGTEISLGAPAQAASSKTLDWRQRDAWADAAAEAAQACLTAAPSLPPEQRKHALARARKLGDASRDVRAGLPPPFDVPLAG